MTLTAWEAAARHFEPAGEHDSRWPTPGDLAHHLDPRTVQTPALDAIDQALIDLVNTPDGRLIITMPPQEGKSTRVAKDFVLWALHRNRDLRVVTASYGQQLANRNGRSIRNAITNHPELGLTVAADNGAAHEWQLAGHDGGVLSVGIGAGVTGRPADMLVIDDPIKDRKEADSEVYRDAVWDWWTDSASTRLAPGAPVVLILTRWHEDDLAGRLVAAEDGHLWRQLNIPAQADHQPDEGETDVLDREPGEFMISARGRTVRQWEAIRIRVGSRAWQALYQGRPSPPEGGMFRRDGWRWYEQPQWIERADGSCWVPHYDDMLTSWDMTFKDTEGTDYVVGQVWMRRGADAYLLDQVRGRMDFVETCQRFRAFHAKWPQAVLKLVEDKANGPAVISALGRIVAGIVPEEPQGSKQARAYAVSPLQEAGNVWLPVPELAPWVGDLVEEAAGFPTATHDDQVDALSQGLNRLILRPLMDGEIVEAEDLDEDLADFAISPY